MIYEVGAGLVCDSGILKRRTKNEKRGTKMRNNLILIIVLLGLISEVQAQNLFENPGFELGIDSAFDLKAYNGSVVSFSGTSTEVFQGDSALKIDIDTVGTGGPQVIGIRQVIPGLDSTRIYSLRAAVKGPAGQKFRFRILGNIKQTKNFTVSGSGFHIYEYLIDPLEPSDDGEYLVAVEFASPDNSAGVWVVDSLVLEDTSGDPGGDSTSLPRVFVSPEGDDSFSGTFDQPVKTVARALDLLDGDTIYLLEGRYLEEAVLNNLAGSLSSPVVITAWKNHQVTFDGTVSIDSAWEIQSGNIYKTVIADDIWQLFADGEMMNLCRWPNVEGFIEDEQPVRATSLPGSLWDQPGTWGKSSSSSINGTMIDDGAQDLSGSGLDMTDAIAILNVGSFKTSVAPVVAHATGQNYFEYDPEITDPYLSWQKPSHAWYFLEGKLNLLDHPGEWYFDKDTKELFLITKDGSHPDSSKIRGRVQSYAFSMNSCEFVELRNIHFYGTTITGNNCSNITIENCSFTYPSGSKRILGDYSPVDITIFDGACSHMKIVNNVFQYSEGEALYLKGTDHLIENNLFRHIDFTCANLYNLGGTVDFIGDRNVFRNNTIYIAGASETITPGSNNIVEGNEVWGIGHLQNDGSMIQYMTGPAVGSVTRYNWLHNCLKSGMRYDGSLDVGNTGLPGVWDPWEKQTKGMVYGNVIWNTPTGLMIKGDYHVIVNNTVFNNEKVGIIMMNPPPDGANPNSLCKNNIAEMISGHRGGRTPDEYPLPGDHSNNWNGFFEPQSFGDIIQDIGNRDFRPRNIPLLVDTGTADIHTDLVVEHSFIDSTYDLGAYEYGDNHYNIPGRRLSRSSHPVPLNNSTSRSDDVILAWRPAWEAFYYQVYFGRSYEEVSSAGTGSPEYMGDFTGNVVDPGKLYAGETLFWRVDAVTEPGVVTGETWSFMVGSDANISNYPVVFKVFGRSGEGVFPLADAMINTGEQSFLTDPDGLAVITLPDSVHQYEVSKKGYVSVKDSFLPEGELEISDTLELEYYSVSVNITSLPDSLFVQGAEVSFNMSLEESDADGLAIFPEIPFDTLTLSIEAEGFLSWEAEVVVDTDTVFYVQMERMVGADNRNALPGINWYPNPASDRLYIDVPENNYHLQITNLQGKVLYMTESRSPSSEISLEGFGQGLYILRIFLPGEFDDRFIISVIR